MIGSVRGTLTPDETIPAVMIGEDMALHADNLRVTEPHVTKTRRKKKERFHLGTVLRQLLGIPSLSLLQNCRRLPPQHQSPKSS